MSNGKKKPANAAPAKVVAAKKVKTNGAEKVKRNSDGSKIMKVARGTERARRRQGLVMDWRTTKGAKQMLPVKGAEQAVTQ